MTRHANNAVGVVFGLIDRAPFMGKAVIQPAVREAYGTYDLVERRAAQETAIRTVDSYRTLNALTALGTIPLIMGAHNGLAGEAALAFQVVWGGAHAACAVRQHALIGRLKKRMRSEEACPPDWDQTQPKRPELQLSKTEKRTGVAITLIGTVVLVLSGGVGKPS